MAVDQKIGLFTAALRSEFYSSYDAIAVPAEFKRYTTWVPSTARIEHYPWLSPTPGVSRFKGHRRYGKIDVVKYSVENIEWDSSFEVLQRDVEDDQTAGYQVLPKQLARRAKVYPSREVLKLLSNGSSSKCFDGTNFFAASHELGSGNNVMTGTGSANADGLSYKFAVLVHNNPELKPLMWQDRKVPDFETDAGSPESRKAKVIRYWIDFEGAAALGYWWDAVQYTFTNQPTLTELQTAFGEIEDRFRVFQLPKASPGEDGEYVHEQFVFDAKDVTIVSCTQLSNKIRQILNSETIVQSGAAVTNVYQSWASYVPSAFMNS